MLGSCAFPLGKKATDAETHKWTVYVRGATPKKTPTSTTPSTPSAASAAAAHSATDLAAIAAAGEDISDVVSKVVFNLHPTFHNPTREVSEPPFELSEMGWGEFDLTAVLHFVDAAGEPPLELAHKLRLYSDSDPQGTNLRKPVVAEVYDEVVFTEPREAFWRAASRARGGGGGGGGGGGNGFVGPRPSTRPYSTAAHFGAPAPEDELRRLGMARQRVAQVMMAVRKQMDTLDAHAAAGGGAAAAAQFAAAQQQQQQQRRQMQQKQQLQAQQQQHQHQQQAAAAAAAAAAAGLPPGFPPPEAMMM